MPPMQMRLVSQSLMNAVKPRFSSPKQIFRRECEHAAKPISAVSEAEPAMFFEFVTDNAGVFARR